MNTDHRPHTAAVQTNHQAAIDGQLRRYRCRKLRERLARQNPHHLTGEAAEILRFALIWAPYGGAPAEEIFQKFGMAPHRFVDKLWQTVEDAGYDLTITREFAAVYPHPDPTAVASETSST